MIFQSLDFLIFFVIILTLHWSLPKTAWRNIALVVAGYFFYSYVHPWFIVLILSSTSVSFLAAIGIERDQKRRKYYLFASIFVNMGTLGFFKYFNFFLDSVTSVLQAIGFGTSHTSLNILLPVGISFYTFQTVSYVVDVYRGKEKACRNPITFALFVNFFPQLVAGPIERARDLIPQLEKKRHVSLDLFSESIVLITWGFFLKLVIADNTAIIANKIFGLHEVSFPILWTGVLAFTIQIYADFAGYSKMARGIAGFFGIRLSLNFNSPYFSKSPTEFWRRWHITLSNWLKEYVYIPLGGSRVKRWRVYMNLLIVFLVSGIWHGADYNFIIWGAYWGFLIMGHKFISQFTGAIQKKKWYQLISIGFTFVLTTIGWLFFRETELSFLLSHLMLSPFGVDALDWRIAAYLLSTVFVFSIPIWLEPIIGSIDKAITRYVKIRILLSYLLVAVLWLSVIFLRSTTSSDFIYFQF